MRDMALGTESKKNRVIIVGAGFAGLYCAQKLAKTPDMQITLIDRNNFHVFQPLLYQVGTGILSSHNAAFNLRALLHKHSNITVKMSEITSVDLETCTAHGHSGDTYQGDYLVLAAGARTNFFDIPGADLYAHPLYSLRDAEKLRSTLLEICETAEVSSDEKKSLAVVIVGGGATGVEIAGAFADLIERTPPNLYQNFDLRRSTVTVIDGGDMVLGPFNKKSQKYATETLRARGIKFHFGCQVKEITATSVHLSDESSLPYQVVIWAAGIKAADLASTLKLAVGHGGRVNVRSDLSVAGFPGVYALGDFANCQDKDGRPLAQLASVAKQAGLHCAANIVASRSGKPAKPFQYFDSGVMAMIGRNAAVAEIGRKRRVLVGPLAFLAWIGVHVLLLNTFRVKVQTLFEWLSEYFGKVNVAAILFKEGS